MQPKRKIYTREEANDTIPWLNYQFGKIMYCTSRLEEIMKELLSMGLEPSPKMMAEKRSDSKTIKELKGMFKDYVNQLIDCYSRIEDAGIIIQDLQSGIVSFYTYIGENLAFLTWQYGENEVRWWHEVFEGVDKKKPLHKHNSYSTIQN